MRKISVEDMRRHVKQLSANIQTFPVKRSHQAKALRDEYGEVIELQLPPVRSALSYATNLHEIGHMKGRHQSTSNVMTRERWAWRWARAERLDLDRCNGTLRVGIEPRLSRARLPREPDLQISSVLRNHQT